MGLRRRLLMLWTLVVLASGPVAAQEADQTELEQLKQEIEALKQGQQQIQRQLSQVLRLLQQQARTAPAPPAAPDVAGKIFDLGANPVLGESTAPLTLVEFTDYQ